MNKLLKAFLNPEQLLKYVIMKCLLILGKPINDELYVKLIFRLHMGKWPNLKNPKTYNEKLQWLKLYDRNPDYTKMVDKIEAKKYVASIIGEEYIIPTIGVWDNPDDIDFDLLPNQFVLKCNHGCGDMCICPDKSKIVPEFIKKSLNEGLKRDYFKIWREWPYKNVKRRVIGEEYLVDESGFELKDYKFFCFDGKPKFMFIASDRQLKNEETKFDFFDMEFNHLPFQNGHLNANHSIAKPSSFELMKELASKLSKGIPHVRVDFYDVNGHVYFGELTFSHWSGLVPFQPEEWDYKFGDMIELPTYKRIK